MPLIPIPGEFGRHFDESTGFHCWDGREDGLDFDVWAYQNPGGSFEVVVKQMLPPPMKAPGASTTWVAHLQEDEPITFQAGNEIHLFPTAPRVVFESLPQAMQDQIWDAACQNFLFPDGRMHRYDLPTGVWSPVEGEPDADRVMGVLEAIMNEAASRRVVCWLDGDRVLIGQEDGEHLYDVSGRLRPGGFVDDAYDILDGPTTLVPETRTRTELEESMYDETGDYVPGTASILATLIDWDGERFTLDVGAVGVDVLEAVDPPACADAYLRASDAGAVRIEAGEGGG